MATNNAGKLAELRDLLPTSIELVSMADAGLESPLEDGSTFTENALIKARHAAPHADAAIADDSGLVVDALGGAPGVRSARFAAENATDDENNDELLRRLANASNSERSARFVSAAAFVSHNGDEIVVEGHVLGTILEQPRGNGGFGYDPLFCIQDPGAPDYSGRTLSELTIAEKNAISHRGRAVRALVATLQERQFIENSSR